MHATSSHIAIINYGSGNIHSITKAVEHVADDHMHVSLTADPALLAKASHVILPGVGAFADCLAGLHAVPGIVDALNEATQHKQTPFLGICVGMQLLFQEGYEHGHHHGLGWLDGTIKPIDAPGLTIPHMGWNTLQVHQSNHPLLQDIDAGDHAYFVHSYCAHDVDDNMLVASSEYGQSIPAIVATDHIIGTQFHPEKSQKTGLQLLHNFVRF